MSQELIARVAAEVAVVHDFIAAWIRGELPDDDQAWQAFRKRFAPDFALLTPGGAQMTPERSLGFVREMHGSNDEFRIEARDANILRARAGLVVATYTEWQRNARHAPLRENGRLSTVVFDDDGDTLRWAWLHETWLPAEVVDQASFDF